MFWHIFSDTQKGVPDKNIFRSNFRHHTWYQVIAKARNHVLYYTKKRHLQISAQLKFAFLYSVLRSTLSQMQSCLFVDQGCQINNLWCSMNQLLSIYFPLLVTANTPDERRQLLPPACHPPWNIVWKQKAEKAKQKHTYFLFSDIVIWYWSSSTSG